MFAQAQQSLDSLRMVLPVGIGHMESSQNAIVLNDDGSKLLTLHENIIKFWDVRSGKELKSITKHKKYLSHLKFSPNGRCFLTVSSDGIFDIWDVTTGKLINTSSIQDQGEIVTTVFNPIGSMLICLTQKGIIGKWDFERTDSEITQIGTIESSGTNSGFREYNAAFNPNGDTLAISNFYRIDFWNVKKIEYLFSLDEFDYSIINLEFDSKGEKIFISTSNQNYEGWEAYEYCILKNKLLLKLKDDDSRAENLIFSPSGDKIFSSYGNQGYLWNSSAGNLIGCIDAHISSIKSVLFNKNETLILTTGDNSMRIWDAFTCKEKFISFGPSDLTPLSCFSSDGWVVATLIFEKQNHIEIWTMKTFRCIQVINGLVEPIEGIYFDNMDQIISTNGFGAIESWDPKKGASNYFITEPIKSYGIDKYVNINKNASKIIFFSPSLDSVMVFELINGMYLKSLILKSGLHLNGCKISDNADKILIEYRSFYIQGSEQFSLFCVYDFLTKELIQEEKDSANSDFLLFWDSSLGLLRKIKRKNYTYVEKFYPSSQNLVLLNDIHEIVVVNSESEEVLLKIPLKGFLIDAFIYEDNKNSYLVFSTRNIDHYELEGEIFVWNINTLKLLSNHRGNIRAENFKFNGKCIVSSNFGSDGHIWDARKDDSTPLFYNNQFIYNAVLQGNLKIIATSGHNIIVIWGDLSGQPIYERIQLENNNWLVKLPNSPYYMCSKDASKMLHYVTPSLKVIGFEQLDPVYNRPDIVLDSIGKYFDNEDRGMIEEYRKSWEKRIDRLGLDKEKLGKGEIAVPSAEIVGADDIAYENKTGELAIEISANDAKNPLRRFNVYVNEVPLYGSAGISIAHLKKQQWDTTLNVPLSAGENKIQVSVMNELGLENFKYPTYVNYSPEKEIVAKTHFIGIGVNEFKEKEHNLKYCVDDVTDLAAEFNSNMTVTKLFTNQNVTRENVLKLKQYLQDSTNVNDKVIISCSSHGLLDDSLNFYLATHDVDFSKPKERGLKYEELESLLDGIPARQKLLLLDACNSGENDKTELLKQDLAKNERNMNVKEVEGAKGVILQMEGENTNNFKKMNELFVNVRNNTGSVIISAAGGLESALEAIQVDGKTIKNGAFTYSILECLKQNEGKELKVNTLKQYAEKRVEEITNGKQKPTSRQETMEIDWGVR
jgi:WD40 repeat protein